MKKIILSIMLLSSVMLNAQITPEIYSWRQNINGITGYNGIPADVQQVFFSDNYTYVKSTGIPSYPIGPWAMNPNIPTNQNWSFKITRFPVADPTPLAAGNGQIGVLINGVVLFNSGDAMSYNNQNIWHRVAQYFEAVSFDTSGGHPAPGGVYHYHINMKYLYTPDPVLHSPLLGYMFDGFPLYGPYAYSGTNGSGGIRRMISGFVKRNISVRTTLPDGTVLQQNQWGPNVSTQYPLGCFVEDYELSGSGTDLDEHNGRFCVTPEYPNGTYAYFITVDSLGNPVYPYIIGKTYYGEVVPGNIPPGGHVVITEPVTQYLPVGISNHNSHINFELYQNYPNPFNPETSIKFDLEKSAFISLKIYDLNGREIKTLLKENLSAGSYITKFNASDLPGGVYFYEFRSGDIAVQKKMVLIK
ncbi:MAG: YHYH protein [Bacteroidetes bacterium]|nr:YHYH protein [Bacteroidota bacterium]